MKKNFKRWLALVLAVVLVSGTCLTHTDSFLWATDGETTETASEDVQDVANETGETDEQQTVEQQPVEEKQEVVIPKKEDAPAPEEKEQEDPVTNEKLEANQSVQDGKPADEGSDGQEVEVVPSDKKENFYNVVFHKPAVEGGTLYVWEEGKEKEEASYINEEFTKEVKEGTTLYFEIQTADNYSVEKVTDKSGEVMTPEETIENTSTYKMVVKEKNEITILYKEVKEEEPTTFNVQDESDRLLGGSKAAREYPEYITATQLGGGYSSPHVLWNRDTSDDFMKQDPVTKKWECTLHQSFGDFYGARNTHYVSIYEDSVGWGDKICYVRCDVYGGEQGGEIYYQATFINTATGETEKKSVKEGEYPKDIPNWGTGYWTAKENDTEDHSIDPTSYNIDGEGEGLQGPATYYWHKSQETPKYTITTSADANSNIDQTITNISQGDTRTVSYSAKTGYTISEVEVDGEKVNLQNHKNSYTFENIQSNHSISVKASANEAKILFEENGGTHVDDLEGKTDEAIEKRTMPETKRSGYEFKGWYTDAEFTGEAVTELPERYPSGTTTYYAKWSEPLSYSITYDYAGGTLAEGESNPESYNVTTETFTLKNPTRTGYTFEGWTGTGLTEETQIVTVTKGSTGNREYTANWKADPAYIQFDTNGGTTVEAMEGTTDAEITDRKMPETTRAGYTFEGWYANDKFEGNVVDELPEKYPVGTTTYYAKWSEPISYTITYDLQGGELPKEKTNPSSYTVETEAITLNNPEREGYTFTGWTGTDVTEPSVEVTIAKGSTGHREYTANWTANEAVIAFVTNGGSEVASMTGTTDATIDDRKMPETKKAGYTFEGWYADAKFTGDKVTKLPEKYPSGTTTYYAKWSAAVEYKITYDLHGGKLPEGKTNPSSYTVESEAITLNNPERAGYTFAGWTGTEIEGTAIDVTIQSGSTGDREYRAQWTAEKAEIKFEENGGTTVADLTGTTDAEIENREMPTTTRTGYTFKGWYAKADLSGSEVKELPAKYPVGTITYYAKWEANPAKITFLENGGSAVTDLKGKTDEAITNRQMPITTRAGYDFLGWFTNNKFEGSAVTQLPEKYPAGTTTYYAKWSNPISYSIKYNYAGGALAEGESNPESYNVTTENFTLKNPTRTGYTFEGWTGTELTEKTKVVTVTKGSTGNREYTANWKADPAYIQFDTNGGTTVETMEGTTDATIADRKMPETTRVGYDFLGWFTNDKFEGNAVNELPEKYPAGTTTYYAKWSAAVEYSITYDLQEGKLPEGKANPSTYTVESEAITLNNPEREGYTFIGWTGTDVEKPSVEVTIAKGSTGDRKYTANWTADDAVIAFETNGGTSVASMTNKTDAEITDRKMPETTRAGYTFEGWYAKADLSGSEVKELPAKYPAGTTTYYAKWSKPISYSITYELQGGKLPEGKKNPSTYTVESKDITLINPERAGYTFAGWTGTEIEGTALNVIIKSGSTGDRAYKAEWTANKAEITFEENGGTTVADLTGTTDADIEKREMPTTTRTGYTFKGWYADAEFTGNKVTQLPAKYPVGTTTYYAKWEANSAKITFVENGGTHVDDLEGKTDEAITNRQMPITTRAGYDFLGWFTNDKFEGSAVTQLPEKYPAGTTTYYAKWSVNFSAVAVTGVNKVYNGDESKIEVTGLLSTDTVRYLVNDEVIENSFTDVTNKDVVVEVTRGSEKHIAPAVDVIITARPLTITAASAEKPYDGEALTSGKYEIAEATENTGLVKDEAISAVTVTGSQTLVGESKNIPSNAQFSKGKATNYAINYVPGTLTVTDDGETPVDPDKVVTKTHEDKIYCLGDTIIFTIKVTNIYDKAKTITVVEQEGVTITGKSVFENVAPGAVVTTTAEYVVTEQDILAGKFKNNVTAKFEGGKDFDNTDEVTKLEEKKGHLSITKETTSTPEDGKAYVLGEEIVYQITVKNDGNLTIKGITVNDELTGNIGDNAWTIDSLAPGESKEFTAKYVVTEADLLVGHVHNEATANGTSPDPAKPEVPVTPGEEEVPTDTAKPSLSVEKTAEPKENDEAFELGDTINYTIRVVNNGNLTIKDIDVNDDLTKENWKVDSLAPKAEQTFTTTYTVTEADLVNGKILNKATATGKPDDPKATEAVTAFGEATVETVTATSHITISKATTSTPKNEEGYALGEAIKYEITVTNDGNQTLKNVVVTDDLTGDEWTIETLAPGAIETFTTEYKVTADDIVAGSVKNEATATAGKVNPESPDPEVDPGDTEDKTENEKPALTSTKALTNKGTGTDGKFKAGDTAEFDIKVTNTGNVTLNDVTVREQLSGAKIVTGKGYTVNEDGTVATIAALKVGETVVVKATYVVTQADVDNGGVKNIASVEGEGAGGKDPEPVDPEEPIPTEPQKPDFTSEKKLTNKGTGFLGKFKVGETATFDITVANTGNVTLKNITVKEQLAGAKIVEGTGYTIDEAGVAVIETLEVGTTVVVKAEYVITQEDVDNGGVKNKVAVNGNGPDEKDPKPQPETPEEEIQTDDKKPTAITEKTLTNSGSGEGGSFKVGETAEFDITVQNTGNVTLKDVVVKEMLNGAKIVAGEGYTVSADGKTATIAVIKVGETATVKAVYTMTQADVDNGEVINTADVEVPGKPDPQNPEEPIPTDPQKPAFTSTKTLENEGSGSDGSFKVGDIAKFDITVRNTGNVTLKDVTVKEQLAGAKIVKGEGYTVSADGTTATIATMEVGATVILKVEYTITQADVDNGGAINSVIVEGEGTGGKDPEPVDPEVPIPTDPEKPALTSTKALTNEGTGTDGKFKVGDTAEFDITVQNTGNVTLNDVTVREQLSGAKIVTGKGYTVSEDGTVATIATLNVGETVVVKATYVVTQADVDNGGVKNIASVEGEGAGGKDPEPVDPEEPIPTEPQKPEFTSEKKLTNEGTGANGKFKVGETAKFDITVENTGNVTLNNITVTEQLEGAVILAGNGYKVVDNVAVIDTLEVGTTVVVKAEYVITQADVDNGGVENTVAVEGEGSGEEKPDPQNPEEEIPTDDKKPTAITAKTLTNSGSGENGSFKVGETAEFDITVQNTGNVTLKDVVVKEMLNGAKIVAGEGYTVSADGKSATIATIKVGETATVKAVYTITQADVDNGQVINTADVEVPGKPDPQSPEEPIPTDPEKPAFTSTKTLTNEGTGADGKFKVGDTAEFDITVKNTGNVTLKDVTVKEQLAGAKIIAGEGYRVSFDGTAVIGTLEVGATVVVKAVYTITQADVDNGGVVNSVAVEGKGPNGEDPRPVDPQEPIPTEDPDPSMSVEKTVTSTNEVYNVGDTITYQIVVKNDGNITLHNVVVTDTLQNAAGEVTFEETEGVTFAGNTAIIDMMAPGETVTLNCSYVVTRADAGNDIMNTAVGDSDETDPTDPSVTEPSDVEDIYNLTINYVYADGRTAAPSVVAQYLAGESFGYASPTIDGYTPDYAFVRTGAEGMPARDVVVTVVYTAIPVPAPTPTPDTPDTPDTPVTPTTPDAGTTTPTDDAVGAEITTNEEGEVEVVPVIEEEVPLAKRDLDDHDCCILHFLLMLAAMIVYTAYTRSMKKRQERIAELAEELETEMLKRKQQESAE